MTASADSPGGGNKTANFSFPGSTKPGGAHPSKTRTTRLRVRR